MKNASLQLPSPMEELASSTSNALPLRHASRGYVLPSPMEQLASQIMDVLRIRNANATETPEFANKQLSQHWVSKSKHNITIDAMNSKRTSLEPLLRLANVIPLIPSEVRCHWHVKERCHLSFVARDA